MFKMAEELNFVGMNFLFGLAVLLGEELPLKQILVALNTILKAICDSGTVGSAHRADSLLRAS